MEFSELIRAYREQHGLSQEALAQIVADIFPRKQAIDVGTISRWERKTSTPNLRNQLFILRKLSISVSVASLQSSDATSIAQKLLRSRFNRFSGLADVPYRLSKPRFRLEQSDSIDDFLGDPSLLQSSHKMLSNGPRVERLRVLLRELSELKVCILRFYQEQQIVGHLAYAVANTDEMQQLLADYHQTTIADFFAEAPNGRMLLNFSAYLGDLALYLFCARHLVQTIEAEPSIDWYCSYSSIYEDWLIYKQLGAKVLLRGQATNGGGIRIGKGRFSAILCGLDSCAVLASPLSAISEQSISDLAEIEC